MSKNVGLRSLPARVPPQSPLSHMLAIWRSLRRKVEQRDKNHLRDGLWWGVNDLILRKNSEHGLALGKAQGQCFLLYLCYDPQLPTPWNPDTPLTQKWTGGVPIMARWKWIRLGTIRLGVRSLASLSGLRIWSCCELWCTSKTRLGSGAAEAVAEAGSCSSN